MTFFPVTNSNLSASHLARYLEEHYPIGKNASCRILKAGINDTYFVNTPSGKFIFRVYNFNWRTKKEIQEEIKFICHLAENNIPVSYPIKDIDGHYIQEFNAPEGKRYGVLFSFAEGEKLHNYDVDAHFKVGALMARFHQVAQDMVIDRVSYTITNLVVEPLEEIKNFLPEDTEEMAFLRSTQKYLIEQFKSVKTNEVRNGVVHLDIWFDNLSITQDNKITIFDFDFCGNGWLCIDMAYYILQLYFIERDENICRPKADAFLAGYESVTKIPGEERRILPMLGVSLYFFYLGVQSVRHHNWSNVFFNETYLKRFINMVLKRYFDLNKLGQEAS